VALDHGVGKLLLHTPAFCLRGRLTLRACISRERKETLMARASKKTQASVDRLLDDLHTVIADAENLLKATASQAGEKVQEARARAEESITAARARLGEARDGILRKGRELYETSDEYVHENPWRVAGIAAGAGLLIGLLCSFKRR
jgi:ElaB/YqjD/DUF883 family membrane-anchored ribosome-binding protein